LFEDVLCKGVNKYALNNRTWTSDIKGALTVGVMVDYFHLWDVLADFHLQPDVEDRHIWRFSSDGQYSAKTAYKGFLWGLYLLSHGKEFGRLGHHPNAVSLFGWSLTTDVGQRIALHAVDSHILSIALCVTRLRRLLIISWSLQESSGSSYFLRLDPKPFPHSPQKHPSIIGGKE